MAGVPWKALGGIGLVLGVTVAILRAKRSESKAPRVALIGDSYAEGLGPELAKLLPDFKFEGHQGTNTSQWAHGSQKCGECGAWLTSFKPDIVLVSLGVNDGTAPNPANYQILVRGLHGLGARVVWIEPPAAVNSPAMRAVIASLGVSTVPAPTLPMANSLHPTTPDGYRIWAQEIARAVI
jgi:lysophospholipase L1-like esterase